MKTSNHGWCAAVKAACAVVATLIAVSAIADGIGALAGPGAGVVFVLAAAVACWQVCAWVSRHPAPPRRVAPGRDPRATAPLALTESNEPARIAA